MKAIDFILLAVIAVIIGTALYFAVRRSKNGGCSCGCDCTNGCSECNNAKAKKTKKDTKEA